MQVQNGASECLLPKGGSRQEAAAWITDRASARRS